MALTTEDVAGIADYARIALTPDELQEMTTYMNEAVALLEPIREYDLDGVEPTFHPIGGLSNVMRAGSARDRYFRVPSILGDDGGDR